jgi:hypothetical protein
MPELRPLLVRALQNTGLNKLAHQLYYGYVHGFDPASPALLPALDACFEASIDRGLAHQGDYFECGDFKGCSFWYAPGARPAARTRADALLRLRLLQRIAPSALLSDEHFTVDGTLIEAWASMKSFRAKGGDEPPGSAGGRNAERDFHGEQRSNATPPDTSRRGSLGFLNHDQSRSPAWRRARAISSINWMSGQSRSSPCSTAILAGICWPSTKPPSSNALVSALRTQRICSSVSSK